MSVYRRLLIEEWRRATVPCGCGVDEEVPFQDRMFFFFIRLKQVNGYLN